MCAQYSLGSRRRQSKQDEKFIEKVNNISSSSTCLGVFHAQVWRLFALKTGCQSRRRLRKRPHLARFESFYSTPDPSFRNGFIVVAPFRPSHQSGVNCSHNYCSKKTNFASHSRQMALLMQHLFLLRQTFIKAPSLSHVSLSLVFFFSLSLLLSLPGRNHIHTLLLSSMQTSSTLSHNQHTHGHKHTQFFFLALTFFLSLYLFHFFTHSLFSLAWTQMFTKTQ